MMNDKSSMLGKGYIHLYCGDGKGKTTASAGLALRAAGNGLKVVFLQFLKSGDSGEVSALAAFGGVCVLCGKVGGFVSRMTEEEKAQTRRIHDENLQKAVALCESGECELLVLDEVCAACEYGLLDEEMLKTFLEQKPDGVEVVMTGRHPQAFMLQAADYVTEMRPIRHPYEKGVLARRGIEY